MKIGIVGNYGHLNLGDEALLLGAIECAVRDGGIARQDVVVLTDSLGDTRGRLQSTGCQVRQLRQPYNGRFARVPGILISIFRSLEDLDWLVFGGGGLLNDSNRSAIPLFAIVCLLARLRGMRVAWWSVGIGPLESKNRMGLARWLLRFSDFVTVRDQRSSDFAADHLGLDLQITPDLAHAISPVPDEEKGLVPIVAVSVIPFGKEGVWFAPNHNQYVKYCEKVVDVINGLLSRELELCIRLIPVSLQQDDQAINDIVEMGGFATEGRVTISHPKSVMDLRHEVGKARVVVATRLHSAVLATLAAVPLVAIAYQSKVSSYVAELNTGAPCFDIVDFSSDDVISETISMLGRWESCQGILRVENVRRKEILGAGIRAWRQLT